MHFSNEYTLKTFTKWTKKNGSKVMGTKICNVFKNVN